MNYHQKLDALRAVIATECDARMKKDHQLDPKEVAKWLLRRERRVATEGLTDIVCQVMEQWNDDERASRVLRARPEPQPVEDLLRQVSQTLGVPLWYLLGLDDQRRGQCCAAVHFIHRLRGEESTATLEAMKQAQEFLRPVMDGHPDMTVEQALRELDRRTDETIRGLDSTGGFL